MLGNARFSLSRGGTPLLTLNVRLAQDQSRGVPSYLKRYEGCQLDLQHMTVSRLNTLPCNEEPRSPGRARGRYFSVHRDHLQGCIEEPEVLAPI